MSNMIYLDFPAVIGDGRSTASFKAQASPDQKRRLNELQREQADLRQKIERENNRRLKAERELAEARRAAGQQQPDVESLLAKLMMQVSGTWKGAAA